GGSDQRRPRLAGPRAVGRESVAGTCQGASRKGLFRGPKLQGGRPLVASSGTEATHRLEVRRLPGGDGVLVGPGSGPGQQICGGSREAPRGRPAWTARPPPRLASVLVPGQGGATMSLSGRGRNVERRKDCKLTIDNYQLQIGISGFNF